MRGIIPGLYQIPLSNSEMKVVQGDLSMWMIHLIEGKLKLQITSRCPKNLPVLTGALRPATSVPI